MVLVGRVIIQLYTDKVPKSAENFRCLCTGEKGIGQKGKPLHYKGSVIHKVIPWCMVQGGDIINGDGTGGESIYGEYFVSENLKLNHNDEGIVGLANNGPNKNSSQFYITSVNFCGQLNGQNVVIGKVVKGLDIVKYMATVPRENDVPQESITIEDCGEIKPGDPWNIEENDGTTDIYPPWPNDWDAEPDYQLTNKALQDLSNSGNFFYYKENYLKAESKYHKILRYINWYEEKTNTKKQNPFSQFKCNAILNLSAVQLKINKPEKALKNCNEVLIKFPNNVKALYRRGCAKVALKEYDGAIRDLKQAYKIHPDDKKIRNMFELAKSKKKKYLQREKLLCSKIFSTPNI
ncbi:hypothetical protein ABEB36_005479 [Hypothenemus hampei]|uniref:peptidylprolyl isomerase n=1 Tax=Hypothenemus hampei TaxID=57062 RepID=A0ABD1EZH1_HYPHA